MRLLCQVCCVKYDNQVIAKGSRVTKEPEIPNFPNANSTNTTAELRGDISANHFWRNGTTAIFDIRVTDTDGPSYRDKDPAKTRTLPRF